MIFAQLSDLHVVEPGARACGRVDTNACLRAAVARLNALEPRPACTVVSGDVVDGGTRAEYAVARDALEELRMPWWPIPGNHDGEAFADVFAERMPDAVRDVGFTIEQSGVRFALLDTRVPGQPHGALDERRAAWLDGALRDAPPREGKGGAPDGVAAVLVMHHPPFDTGIAHMDRIGLRGRERLLPILLRHRPLGVLCGHVHRTIHTTLAGVPVCIAPSPAHAVRFDLVADGPAAFDLEPPAILVHRIEAGVLSSHTVFVDEHDGPYPFAASG